MLLPLAASVRCHAAELVASVVLDPARTVIAFTVSTTTHTVHGTFRLERGLLQVDPVDGRSQGEIVVDAISGQSGNSLRDARMRSAVLQTTQYPRISFTVAHVQIQSRSPTQFQLQAQGFITLCGARHPMTLNLAGHINGGSLDAETRFPVPYVRWGLEDPSILFLKVDPAVTIEVHAIGRLTWQTGFVSQENRGAGPAHR